MSERRIRERLGLWLVGWGLVGGLGCTGALGDPGSGASNEPSNDPAACALGNEARTPLRRLTNAQLAATLRDLLGVAEPTLTGFVVDASHRGFEVNLDAPSDLQVKKLLASAASLASDAAAGLAPDCDLAEGACLEDFVERFGARAYRRPLDLEEIEDLVSFFRAEVATSDVDTAFRALLQTMILSPYLGYQVEVGRGRDADGYLVLTGHEIASRLSYFLWGTMPDEPLFDVAESGGLDSPEGVAREARRMLADPRARDMVVDFQRQWLDLRELDHLDRSPELFPDWSPAILDAMREETATFFREVLLEGDGRLATLLTAQPSHVDPVLSDLYGVLPDGALPGGERAGFLTQGVFLVSRAKADKTSWVNRGRFVRTALLCQDIPPPPPGVSLVNTNDPDRFSNPQCSGCHRLMDPIGQGFDRYDPIGRYADHDISGNPVSGGGTVIESTIGDFDSVVGLAHELADSATVRDCFARTWTTFALAREPWAAGCADSEIVTPFEESGGDVRELIVAVATSRAFRTNGIEGGQR